MAEQINIRQEVPADYPIVEALIRQAFWNLYEPGCAEHYLAHVLRDHPDFLPELDLVIEKNSQIIGNIMYTKAQLTDDTGSVKPILSFGPVAILPKYQRQGYGRQLLEASFALALKLGYDVIVIYGSPANYVSRGFQSCKKFNVHAEDGSFPAAMLVKELKAGVLKDRRWVCRQSPAFAIDIDKAAAFDQALEPLEKSWKPCQEEFYILSQAVLPE